MRIPVVAWIALGALALWLFSRRSAPTAMGARGSIQSISVDGVPMGLHGVTKSLGSAVNVQVGFTGLTKDFQGRGITWRYKIRLFVATTGAIPYQFQIDGTPINGDYNLVTFNTVVFNVPMSIGGGLYSVTAFLQAEGSTATGTGTGTFSDIPGVSLIHPDAINLVVSGAAIPAGSIQSVNVAQAILAQMNRG